MLQLRTHVPLHSKAKAVNSSRACDLSQVLGDFAPSAVQNQTCFLIKCTHTVASSCKTAWFSHNTHPHCNEKLVVRCYLLESRMYSFSTHLSDKKAEAPCLFTDTLCFNFSGPVWTNELQQSLATNASQNLDMRRVWLQVSPLYEIYISTVSL